MLLPVQTTCLGKSLTRIKHAVVLITYKFRIFFEYFYPRFARRGYDNVHDVQKNLFLYLREANRRCGNETWKITEKKSILNEFFDKRTLEPKAASFARRTANPRTLLPAPTLRLASDVDFASGRGWSCCPLAWKNIACSVCRQKCVTG